MYSTFFRANFFFYNFLAIIFLVNPNLNASALSYFFEHNFVYRENLEIQIENLFKTFDLLKEYGIDINHHPEIFESVLPILSENKIHVSEKDFNEIKKYILNRFDELNNPTVNSSRAPRLPTEKQPEYSKGFLCGFVQVLAGFNKYIN
jgi:hypothetical protein